MDPQVEFNKKIDYLIRCNLHALYTPHRPDIRTQAQIEFDPINSSFLLCGLAASYTWYVRDASGNVMATSILGRSISTAAAGWEY